MSAKQQATATLSPGTKPATAATLVGAVGNLLDAVTPVRDATDADRVAYREILQRRHTPQDGDVERLGELCQLLGIDRVHLELHFLVLDEADRLAALHAELPAREKVLAELGERERPDVFPQQFCRMPSASYSFAFHSRNEAFEAAVVLHAIQVHFRELFDNPPPAKAAASRSMPASILNKLREIELIAEKEGRRR